MNCKLHPDKPAVLKCTKCGVGVCQDCAKQTESTGAYCVKCAYTETVQDIAFDEELKSSFKRNSRLLLILWLIGLPLFIAGVIIIPATNNIIGLFLLLAGIIISGIPTAIQYWKKGANVHDEYEKRFGETYHVTDSGVYKEHGWGFRIGYAFMGLFLGLILVPGIIMKNNKCVREIDEELEEIVPIKEQLANYYNKEIKNAR